MTACILYNASSNIKIVKKICGYIKKTSDTCVIIKEIL